MYHFSVVICTYNGEKFIKEQLESILNQTKGIEEIIVCDDGSTDGTLAIVKKVFSENEFTRYQIFGPQQTRGVAANFLRGMKASKGDYVFCCDQDDVWLRDKVSIFAKAIESSNKQLYFSDGYIVESDLSRRGYSLWDSLNFSIKLLEKKPMLDILLNRCVVTGAAMAVSRELINQIDEIPDCWLHDGWFAAVAACNESIQAIDKKTFLYRQHGGNVVGASSDSYLGRMKSWVHNISDQKRIRRERYARYKCVQQKCGSDSPELSKCLQFWGELCGLEEKGKIASLETIISLLREGSYEKYYTGGRGALRDVLSLFISGNSEHL